MPNEQDQQQLDMPQGQAPQEQIPDEQQMDSGVDGEGIHVPQEKDDFAGPTGDDFVGDRRRLKAVSLPANYLPGGVIVGEAWQDDLGKLHGTGLFAVMLFEPTVQNLYKNGSVGFDISPLELLYRRLSRNSFMHVELNGENNG